MILSEQTDLTAQAFGLDSAIEMIADAGFDAIDLSMFYSEKTAWMFENGFESSVLRAKSVADSRGLFFNQAHAPFPTLIANDDAYNKENRNRVIRSLEIAGMLNIKNIVVHPVVFPDHQKERNIEMYLSFLPYAKRAGVKIALENMWGWDNRRGVITKNVCSDAAELADYVDTLPEEFFTVCLDLGHIGLVGDYEAETIRKLGASRLTCLHVHDNDYRNDSHNSPFTMKLPWREIADALAGIGYAGDLTLESDNFLSPLPHELYASGLRFMHDAGRFLIHLIEDAKKQTV